MNNTPNNSVITKKDIHKMCIRNCMSAHAAFNYETFLSGTLVLSIGPLLEKIYKDEPDKLQEKMDAYLGQFFNTQVTFQLPIFGAIVAVEETKEPNATETATAIKTSLMGPLAGIGDSLLLAMPKAIIGALAGYWALEGSYAGIFIALAWGVFMMWLKFFLGRLGYEKGVQIITKQVGKFNAITQAAAVLGMVVVGSMIASTVTISTPLVFKMGEISKSLQDTLNTIIPALLPLVSVALVGWGLGKKHMTMVRMVWLMIIAAIVLSALGILI